MHDLYLVYKFTDRGGQGVYDAFHSDDRLKMQNKLFEIRIRDDQVQHYVTSPATQPDDGPTGGGTG